jgi:CBS domain-containing protein
MQIATLVNPRVVWAESHESLVALARRMMANGIGSLPVRDRGRLAGIVTERDIVAAVADGIAVTAPAGACMTAEPAVATPAEDSADVALRMLELGVRHLPVVEQGRVVGMVSARDLLMLEAWPGSVPPVAPVASQ